LSEFPARSSSEAIHAEVLAAPADASLVEMTDGQLQELALKRATALRARRTSSGRRQPNFKASAIDSALIVPQTP